MYFDNYFDVLSEFVFTNGVLVGGVNFDSRPSKIKDFILVVEDPLSNARHIKGTVVQRND